jgi:Tol biopolymer transport system component
LPDDWSGNGFLLYESRSQPLQSAQADLLALPVNGGEPIVVARSPAMERNGRFSPDGKWVVYESNEVGGRYEIFIQPFPGSTAQRRQVSASGGFRPLWGRGGSEIYFMSPDDHLMVAEVRYLANGDGVEIKSPAPLFPVPLPATSEFDTIDGERFLVNMPTQESTPIIVLSGWAGKK